MLQRKPLNQEQLADLLHLLKQYTVFLNGRAITWGDERYDAHGNYQIRFETERISDSSLEFPVEHRRFIDVDVPVMEKEGNW